MRVPAGGPRAGRPAACAAGAVRAARRARLRVAPHLRPGGAAAEPHPRLGHHCARKGDRADQLSRTILCGEFCLWIRKCEFLFSCCVEYYLTGTVAPGRSSLSCRVDDTFKLKGVELTLSVFRRFWWGHSVHTR